jgi:hypothetical protein
LWILLLLLKLAAKIAMEEKESKEDLRNEIIQLLAAIGTVGLILSFYLL